MGRDSTDEQQKPADVSAEGDEMKADESHTSDEVSEESGAEAEAPSGDDMGHKLQELQDKYLRLYSEFENFRKRSAKEKLDLIQQASAGLAKEILTVLDDFDRANKANVDTQDPEALKEGFKLIGDKLIRILVAKGIKEIEAQGQPFDVDKHEAISQIPAEDDKQKGTVVDVVEKGYTMNDIVIRYAKVVVAQ